MEIARPVSICFTFQGWWQLVDKAEYISLLILHTILASDRISAIEKYLQVENMATDDCFSSL
jgi:hypothetical protein